MKFETIKELFDINENSFGFPEEKILEAEERLGVRFPKILKAYYEQLGTHRKLNKTQNRLISLNKIEIDEYGFLIFYAENQQVVVWGIQKEDMNLTNPKVYRKEDKKWHLDSNLLSTFLTSMAFMQAIFAFDFHANVCGVEPEYMKLISENYRKTNEEFPLWNVNFYRNKATELISLFRDTDQLDLFISAKNQSDFKAITDKINIDWDYHSERDES